MDGTIYGRSSNDSLRGAGLGDALSIPDPQPRPEMSGMGGMSAAMMTGAARSSRGYSDAAQARIDSGKHVPVVIRNNNPGAISFSGSPDHWITKVPGYIGKTARPKAEGGYYAKFDTPEHGAAAQAGLLRRYGDSGKNTISKIVKTWADEPGNYAKEVADATGYGVDDVLDFSDPAVVGKIAAAMSAHRRRRLRPLRR